MTVTVALNRTPRPFLKWVGGKRQLLPDLLLAISTFGSFNRYHEPFVGGGALFFELMRLEMLDKKSYLYDVNPNLMEAYHGVRDEIEKVIKNLKIHSSKHSEEYFYKIRSSKYRVVASRTARIIYLNKTCFNGLFRENKKGQFNAPFGRYKNPTICDKDNLIKSSKSLKNTRLLTATFPEVLKYAKKGDLVYFDPPYMPISKTSDFTSYAKEKFTYELQLELSEVYKKLSSKGVKVILSNSKTDLTQELYKDFTIKEVMATRLVNSVASKRGKIFEILVCNY